MKEYENLAVEAVKCRDLISNENRNLYGEGYIAGFLKAREMILPTLRLARMRLSEIDLALSIGRPELAQEIWKHAFEEINRAIIYQIGEREMEI